MSRYLDKIKIDNSLRKIYLEPTTTCNLKCTTCLRNNWDETIGLMSEEVFDKFIEDIKSAENIECVAFWGIGEPLTHPNIADMISRVNALGIETEMISNAMRLDALMAEKLIDAGLNRLVISVDSTIPEQLADIRSGATLNNIVEHVKALNHLKRKKAKVYPEIGIEFTAMKKNISQLKNLKELAYLMEAVRIIVTNLLPYNEEDKDQILYWNAATEFHQKKPSKYDPQISLPRVDVSTQHAEHLGKISFEAMSHSQQPLTTNDYKGVCPFVERGALAVSRTGEVSPCVPLMHSYTCYILGDKKMMKRYSMANIMSHSLTEVWEAKAYQKLRHKLLNDEFSLCVECGRCDMAESNEEDCLGNTHPTCGDCLWAKGIIQCP